MTALTPAGASFGAALSDILKSVRLDGAAFLEAEFTAPWCVQAKYGLASLGKRWAAADRVIYFSFFAEGGCRVPLPDGAGVLDVVAGDLVLFLPGSDRQLMASDLRIAPADADSTPDRARPDGEAIRLRHGGGGTVTRVVCGYFACGSSACRPLLQALPRVMRIPTCDGPASKLLGPLLNMALRESAASRPGSESTLARLSELLFVEVLRRYVERLPAKSVGWLAGVRDLHVGRALALIHGAPGRPWTVDALAREVALSRSALAERFAALVGEPPIQYLMRWRLALAAQMLRSGAEAIGRVAERIGYESDAAFSRAFKREFGMPPATWRKSGPALRT